MYCIVTVAVAVVVILPKPLPEVELNPPKEVAATGKATVPDPVKIARSDAALVVREFEA